MNEKLNALTDKIDELYAYKDVLEELSRMRVAYMKYDDVSGTYQAPTRDEESWSYDRYKILDDLIKGIYSELKIK